MADFLWENFFRNKKSSFREFLGEQKIFSSLSDKELKLVERIVHLRSYFPGEIIFKPGSSIGLYMVLKGEVHIFYGEPTQDKPVVISTLKEGDFFGELSLVQEKSYQKTSARAETTVELLGFFKPELMSLIDKSPRLGCKILIRLSEILGTRLQKAGEQLISSQGGS